MTPTRGFREGAARVELVRDHDRPSAFLLSVDGVAQSFVDLEDPQHLDFEYTALFGAAIDSCFETGRRLDAVHLGAGACTMARYVASTRPGSRQRAYDADAEVVDLVKKHLDIAAVPGLTLRVGEAREVLHALPDKAAHLVITDAYDGPHASVSVLTLEAMADARRVLRPTGVFLVNVADRAPFDFGRPVLATLRTTFDHVAMLADIGALRGRRFGNLVLIASQRPLPIDELRRRAAGSIPPARLVVGDRYDTLVGDALPMTDASPAVAPVLRSWIYERTDD